jgi:hypothetical protein
MAQFAFLRGGITIVAVQAEIHVREDIVGQSGTGGHRRVTVGALHPHILNVEAVGEDNPVGGFLRCGQVGYCAGHQ